MNRKIKFRAWDEVGSMIIEWKDLKRYSFEELQEARAFTFMQYTGLTDKNGVEIYEGDIVANDIGEEGVVRYETTSFIWGNDFSVGMGDVDEIEVIGNIYEDEELLED